MPDRLKAAAMRTTRNRLMFRVALTALAAALAVCSPALAQEDDDTTTTVPGQGDDGGAAQDISDFWSSPLGTTIDSVFGFLALVILFGGVGMALYKSFTQQGGGLGQLGRAMVVPFVASALLWQINWVTVVVGFFIVLIFQLTVEIGGLVPG